jgi:23S rRNA (uracil1939-C5)-methyltransferase
MLNKLIPFALAGLKGRAAMDLYCGIGLFGTFLKDSFNRILAVEENPIALSYARRNIGNNHVFLQGKLEEMVLKGQRELLEFHPEVILVDPPRSGLDVSVQNYLVSQRPEKLVYVSCNPVTLARDLKVLLGSGFVLEDLRLFDFYPQTSHIEVVAKLRKT